MKLKLVCLLFSQVANALTIDKTNYKQHLCDEHMFVPVETTHEILPSHIMDGQVNHINGEYQAYCNFRSKYAEAIENIKTATWRTHKPCGGDPRDFIEPYKCAEKQGVYYAQACEKLKQDKESMPIAWNSVVPKLVACNNI
jgi:hypothetical protein